MKHKVLISLTDRIRLLFKKDKESYSTLYNILGFIPKSLKPYRTAFTHSSLISNSSRRSSTCNERLEFLGDAVLSAVVSDFLYTKFHNEREGFLSKSRSNLVCRERLNNIACQIGLDKLVDTKAIEQRHNNYIYGNAFEAFIGAIYTDRGYFYCKKFLTERIFPLLGSIEDIVKTDKNYKSRLIEWGQKKHKEITFQLISEEQKDNGYYFVSEVYINGELSGLGEGYSKRESQQNAAQEALSQIHKAKTA